MTPTNDPLKQLVQVTLVLAAVAQQFVFVRAVTTGELFFWLLLFYAWGLIAGLVTYLLK